MTSAALIELWEFLLAISLLFWLYKGPWQTLLIDITRQRIFESRDKIFLYAVDGKLELESKVYKEIREYLNDSIRLCHRIGLRSMIATHLSRSKSNQTNKYKTPSLHETINEIKDPDIRKIVKEEILKANYCIARMMVFRSFIAFVLFITYSLYLRLKGRYARIKIICELEHVIERDVRMGDT